MAAVRGQDGQESSVGREGCSAKISAGRQRGRGPQVSLACNGGRLDWPTPHAIQTTEEEALARGVEHYLSQPAGALRNDFLPAGDVPQLQLFAGGISQKCSVARECDRTVTSDGTVTALRDLRCLVKGAHHAGWGDFKNVKPVRVPRVAAQPLVVGTKLEIGATTGDAC